MKIKYLFLFFYFFSLFSLFMIPAKGLESVSVYTSQTYEGNILHEVTSVENIRMNRISQINFEKYLPAYLNNLNSYNSFVFQNAQNYTMLDVKDMRIIHPNYPNVNSRGCFITRINAGSGADKIDFRFTNSFKRVDFEFTMVLKPQDANVTKIIAEKSSGTHNRIEINWDTRNIYFYEKSVLSYTWSTDLPVKGTYEYVYLYFTNYSSTQSIFGWIASNSGAWVSDNAHLLSIVDTSVDFDIVELTTTLDLNKHYTLLGFDCNYYLDMDLKSAYKTYEVEEFDPNWIDFFYYSDYHFDYTSFIHSDSTSISYENSTIEKFNYGQYQLFRTSDGIVSLFKDGSLNQNLLNTFKNNFRYFSDFVLFDTHSLSVGLEVYEESALVFDLNTANISIYINPTNYSEIIIKENSTIKLTAYDGGWIESVAPVNKLIHNIKIKAEFYKKYFRIDIMLGGNQSAYTYYNYNAYLKNITYNVGKYYDTISHTYSDNPISIKSIELNNSLNPVDINTSFTNKLEVNKLYDSTRIHNTLDTYRFYDNLEIVPLVEQYSSIEFEGQTLYLQNIEIKKIEGFFERNYTNGNVELTDFIEYYDCFTFSELSIHQLTLINDYEGYSNASFIQQNGGTLIFYTYLNSPTFSYSLFEYRIVVTFGIEYAIEPSIDFYFNTGLEILLPMILISVFVLGMYSESKSKYFAIFGFMIGLLVIYLIGILSLNFFIFMIFLSIVAFYIIVKNEGGAEE